MVTGIDVIIYNAQDFERALAFYRGLIGTEPATLRPGMWAEFELSDGTAFAIGKHEDYPWQPGYAVALAVPDITEAVALARSLGAKLADASESPVCHMAMGQDSEGNTIVLHQRKK